MIPKASPFLSWHLPVIVCLLFNFFTAAATAVRCFFLPHFTICGGCHPVVLALVADSHHCEDTSYSGFCLCAAHEVFSSRPVTAAYCSSSCTP